MNKGKILKNAERYVIQGRIPAAISEYRKLIDSNSHDLPILNIVGDLYVRLGNTTEGLRYFNQLATAFLDSGYKVKAIAIYKKITKVDPKAVDARQKLAELYALQGLMSEARVQYLQVADLCLAQSKPEAATEALRRLLNGDPENLEVLGRLVKVEIGRGSQPAAVQLLLNTAERLRQKSRWADAKELLGRAQEIDAEAPAVKMLLARVLSSEGQATAAIELLQRMDPEQKWVDVQVVLFEILAGANRLDEADGIARTLVSRDAAHFPLLFSVSERYLANADFNRAVLALDPLIESASFWIFGAQLSEMLQKILSEDPNFLPAIERSVTVNKKLGQNHLISLSLEHLASYHLKEENFQQAMTIYEELLQLDPGNSIVRQGMERLRGQMKRKEATETEAIPEENPAVGTEEFSEKESSRSDWSAQPEFNLREPVVVLPSEGAHTLRRVDAADTLDLVNRLILDGELLVGYGLLKRSVQSFEEVVHIDPQQAAALRRLVEIYTSLDRLTDAALCAAKLSKVAIRAGQVDEARKWTEKAITLDDEIRSMPIDVEVAATPSQVTGEEKVDETVPRAGKEAGAYDLSGELEKIADHATVSASPERPQATDEKEDQRLKEIDFYMEQGFWAETRALIEKALLAFPSSPLLLSRLKQCEAVLAEQKLQAAADSKPEAPVAAPEEKSGAAKGVPPGGTGGLLGAAEPSLTVGLGEILSEFDIVEGPVPPGGTSADFNTHYNLGIAFREMGLMEEAIAEVQTALALIEPQQQPREYLSVCSLLGMCLVESKSYEEAVEVLESAVALFAAGEKTEEFLSVHYDFANALQLAGNTDRALEVFQKIQNVNPRFQDVEQRLQILRQMKSTN